MAASSAACRKFWNSRTGNPKTTSVESTKCTSSPKSRVSTSEAAVDITLCPEVYSGKGGVCNRGIQSSSMYKLIYVSGLINALRYFSSQQERNPSKTAKEVMAMVSEVSFQSNFLVLDAMPAIPIQWPPGVIFFS